MGTKRLATLAAALVGIAATSAWAQKPDSAIIESSLEIQVRQAQLPNGVDGRVLVSPCDTCQPQNLQLSATTGYAINGAKASLSELRAAMAGGSGWLTIHFDLRDRYVTRIDLVK
jgi:hypothetical protein